LNGYGRGKIEQDWLEIKTPTGIRGWMRGNVLRELDGPFLSLSFVHQPSGWKIENICDPDEPDETEPADP
jgi:hypothetical protein